MVEEWQDIEGYEGKYQVSNTGKVKSLNYNNTGKPKELTQKSNRYGYMEVKLSKNNKTKNFLVSTLVGKAFIPNKYPDKIISHISEDVTDNSVGNLKWVYKSEMLFNEYKRGRRKGTPSENTISFNGKTAKKRYDLARKFGMTPKQLGHRLSRGWSLDEALTIPVNKNNVGGKPKFYEYYGKMMSLKQISSITGIEYDLMRKRISKGWNIYEASEIPKNIKKKKEVK